jgi:predicted ATPase/class 3 adenylate cyclase
MDSLPSGTVIFLFTDLENSTSLFQQHPQAMKKALKRHHDILTQAIEAHHGYVFQIVGDSFCAAFNTAQEAVLATTIAQRYLQQEPWGDTGPLRVRMGLHSGTAEIKLDEVKAGQYSGYPSLAHTQRVMDAGHGGQILVSQAIEALLSDELPEAIRLLDLGEFRLKGIPHPERLYQVLAAGLPVAFPPLRISQQHLNNLPVSLTSFVGRQKELAEIHAYFKQSHVRLLTLTGSGGCGKTRLALKIAEEVLDQFSHGVWFVELAALSEPGKLVATILSTLGMRYELTLTQSLEGEGYSPLELLEIGLRNKSLLLVLDNCEHLIQACSQLAGQLLKLLPRLRILATSREALGVPGEVIFHVPSLSLPESEGFQPDRLLASEAVCLFLDRTRSIQPGFKLTEENIPHIIRICQRLDGVPLALELAAARLSTLSVEQVAKRLTDTFRLLTGGSRTALPRQQTLRATIDWSYNLLSEPERQLLRRLAVFFGGWTLEAAESICDECVTDKSINSNEQVDILNILSSLVQKSLVQFVQQEGLEERYHLLETIRLYAREKLQESGEAETLHQQHLKYFRQLAQEADVHLRGAEEIGWLDRLDAEHANMRKAMDWGLDGEGEVLHNGLELVSHLWQFWLEYLSIDGLEWLERALEVCPVQNKSLRARLLYQAGFSDFWWQGQFDFLRPKNPEEKAGEYLQESIDLFSQVGDGFGKHLALGFLGVVNLFKNNEKTRNLIDQAVEYFKGTGNVYWTAEFIRFGAFIHFGDTDPSILLAESLQALEYAEKSGSPNIRSFCMWQLGHVYYSYKELSLAVALEYCQSALQLARQFHHTVHYRMFIQEFTTIALLRGDLGNAQRFCEEAIQLTNQRGTPGLLDLFWKSEALYYMGHILIRQSLIDKAETYYRQSLEVAREIDVPVQITRGLYGCSLVAGRRGQYERQTRLLGAANRVTPTFFPNFDPPAKQFYEHEQANAHAFLGEVAFQADWQAGAGLTQAQAIAEALAE